MVLLSGLEKTPSSHLKVSVESVQRQIGPNDCGLFATAVLVEVLHGGDPKKVTFDQKLLRQNFVECINKQLWKPFPKQTDSVKRVDCKTINMKVV